MIVYRIITGFLLFLGFISKRLTISQRTRFGSFIGDCLIILSKKRKKITLENISLAFPCETRQWHNKVIKESYRNLGITMVELLAFDSFSESDFSKYMKCDNIELVHEVYSRGKGLIFLSGHFGNWEILAYSVGLFTGISIKIIVKPQRNTIADELLNKYRCLGGNTVVSMYNSARTIVRTLLEKKSIALLADQSATKDKDIFVDFFGRPAATYESPADMALRFDIPVIMGFAVRQSDCTYRVKLIELKHDDLKHDTEGIKELTRRHVQVLEDAIRQNPGHWAWQHRRWKHSIT
jgi:Kdo2-lipid IVA lauroyltransferase/acyltransferase